MGTVRGSVLILLNERQQRRSLFELLDRLEFEAIYAARDAAQARAMLSQESGIELIVLEFAEGDAEAKLLCHEIRAHPRASRIPVLAVLAADPDRVWPGGKVPEAVSDWIAMPIDLELARGKIERLFQPATAAAGPPNCDEYRFAFDHARDEMLVSDPASGRILDANLTFYNQSGFAADQVIGVALDDFDLSHRGTDRRELMATVNRTGSHQFQCLVPRANGPAVAMDVLCRLVRVGADVRCLSMLRPAVVAAANPAINELLDGLWSIRGAEAAARAAGQKLIELGRLDLLMLNTLPGEDDSQAGRLALNYARPGVPKAAVDAWAQALVARVRAGETVQRPSRAGSQPGLALSGPGFQVEAVLALPLLDSDSKVIGSLLAAAREPFADSDAVLIAARAVAGRLAQAVELERALDQSRAKGLQDSLTGLPNRLLFNDRLDITLREAHRTGEMFAVLFVDLDRFKTVNDSLGHGVGDELLLAVAGRLSAAVRGSDTVARYAGDEFTLILRHIVQRDDVLRIAEKICRILESPLTVGTGRELHITASIGISFYPDDADTAEKLLQHSDIAMYNAKGMGRNTFQAYVAVPEESHQQRLALEAKLRQAERNGELRAYYQPQVSAQTEDIIGMEALIRWEHPELGMISPGFFIPLAEENGLIMPIGEWMLRTACADAKRWNDRFGHPLRVSVNLSALQLKQPNLVEMVASVLRESGLEAPLLELEVTESINVKTIPNLVETLQGLRELGCSIAIDDFGTGQSSLDYIRRFPADRIKIDQVFVRNIGVDPDDEAIVRATISMAQSLNRGVIAEGVEYEEHLNFLRDNGCEELQGYLFSRPLPAATFENMMLEREKILLGSGTA